MERYGGAASNRSSRLWGRIGRLGAGTVLLAASLSFFCRPSQRIPESGSEKERASEVESAPATKSASTAGADSVRHGKTIMSPEEARYAIQREEMVERQLRRRGIEDPAVLAAMARVPRHLFVPEDHRDLAYADGPLPIGHDQTISQPYIVALMTELARPRPGARALDIGTGSGYQAAVLAELTERVYSIEILRPLAEEAAARLRALGYDRVEVRCGDGYRGWPEQAPFDLIVLAAAPDRVPQPLIDQLAPGGRLVLPVGDRNQELVVVEKLADGSVRREGVIPVRFVPMTGEAEREK